MSPKITLRSHNKYLNINNALYFYSRQRLCAFLNGTTNKMNPDRNQQQQNASTRPNRNNNSERVYNRRQLSALSPTADQQQRPIWWNRQESIPRYLMSYQNVQRYYYNQCHQQQPTFQLSFNCFHRAQFSQSTANQLTNAPPTRRGDNSMGGLRFWEHVNSAPAAKKPSLTFTLMSYNVLAQDLVVKHPHLYSLHYPEHMKWPFRWKNLHAEIKQTSPDIFCLQEVQGTHNPSHYSAFRDLGYDHIYKQRTGKMTDGCAIFFKSAQFNLIESVKIEYKQPKSHILNRDNVGIIAKLAPKSAPNAHFIVATTHLLYTPKRQDVRLAQTQILLTEIERFAFNGSENQYIPIILTGDFNSRPNSTVYNFLVDGQVKYEDLSTRLLKSVHPSQNVEKTGKVFLPPSLGVTDDCQHFNLLARRHEKLSRDNEWEFIGLENSEGPSRNRSNSQDNVNKKLFSSGILRHKFDFKSVYSHFLQDGDLEATTYQDEWLTVDYIFYSDKTKKKLILLDRFKLPTRNNLGDLKIPSASLGSDHVSLIAKFKLFF